MDQLRLFTAVRPPDDVLDSVLGIAEELRRRIGTDAVRWVRRENLHVTLHFLGNTPRETIAPLTLAVETAADEEPPVNLRLASAGAFPSALRPRTLWVGVDDPDGSLARLERRLRRYLVDPGQPVGSGSRLGLNFKLDERPFRPHITVGYVRKKIRSAESRAITTGLQQTRFEPIPFVVDRLLVVQSTLARGGSNYVDLVTTPLRGAPPGR